LETALGPRLTFSRFDWSGLNSHRARDDAAKELATHIQQLHHANPGSECYLICHSHGGNVALRAVAQLDTERSIRGLITLGTPFIVCHKRRISLALRALAWAIPISFFMITMSMLAPFGVAGIDWLSDAKGPLAGGIALVFGPPLTGLILLILSFKIRKWTKVRLAGWILTKQFATERKFSMPKLSNIQVLSLYVRHDEAGGFLSFIEFMGNLFHWLYSMDRLLIIFSGSALISTVILRIVYQEYELVFETAMYDLCFFSSLLCSYMSCLRRYLVYIRG
jgi:hypothetical protein